MSTKIEEFKELYCPRCTSLLVGIGLPGTTIFNCNNCKGGWIISDTDVIDSYYVNKHQENQKC